MGEAVTTSVLVIGGGPVGLLTALRLGQAGVDATVVEAHEDILPTTRAMVYMPIVIPLLKQLGIIKRVEEEAFLNRDGIMWRDLDGAPLAHLPLGGSEPHEFGGVLLLGQYKMAMIILEELKNYPCVQVRFGLQCGGLEDDPASKYVKALVHNRNMKDPDSILYAKYVLAADGASCTIRQLLCLTFDGFTYPDWKVSFDACRPLLHYALTCTDGWC
jgi:2-polyprenyl-6-methoxyphenol hydroxylase-like FAD-dependent oxidoreductase